MELQGLIYLPIYKFPSDKRHDNKLRTHPEEGREDESSPTVFRHVTAQQGAKFVV
jgi:hypothetical protein